LERSIRRVTIWYIEHIIDCTYLTRVLHRVDEDVISWNFPCNFNVDESGQHVLGILAYMT
jgi:hypothetical protein